MSQFDDLLDFEPSARANENGKSQKIETVDDFDPFGPSPTIEIKGGGDPFEQNSVSANNSADPFGCDPFGGTDPFTSTDAVQHEGGTGEGVLLDFSYDAEVSNTPQNGTADENHYEVDFLMTTPTDQSESAIYEIMEPQNPLYENVDPTKNLLYEYKKNSNDSDLQMSPEESSNPLYDYIDNSDQGVELLVTPSDDSGIKSAEIIDDVAGMVTKDSESPRYHDDDRRLVIHDDDDDDDRWVVIHDDDDRRVANQDDDRRVVDQDDDDRRVVDQDDDDRHVVDQDDDDRHVVDQDDDDDRHVVDQDDDRRVVDQDDDDDRRVVDQDAYSGEQCAVKQDDGDEEEEEMVIITEDCIIGSDGEVTIMKSETETLREARPSRSKSLSESSSEEEDHGQGLNIDQEWERQT